jgi:hypothetical protein
MNYFLRIFEKNMLFYAGSNYSGEMYDSLKARIKFGPFNTQAKFCTPGTIS